MLSNIFNSPISLIISWILCFFYSSQTLDLHCAIKMHNLMLKLSISPFSMCEYVDFTCFKGMKFQICLSGVK